MCHKFLISRISITYIHTQCCMCMVDIQYVIRICICSLANFECFLLPTRIVCNFDIFKAGTIFASQKKKIFFSPLLLCLYISTSFDKKKNKKKITVQLIVTISSSNFAPAAQSIQSTTITPPVFFFQSLYKPYQLFTHYNHMISTLSWRNPPCLHFCQLNCPRNSIYQ